MLRILRFFWLLLLTVQAQQYDYDQDYAQDNLYHDYAKRQEVKEQGGGGGGFGMPTLMFTGLAGWWAGGKFHSRRLKKKLDAKHKEEQKALYQQYYNDVYTLQTQNAELVQALEQYGVRMR